MTSGISAVIITKNEEKNIERCLLSLKSVVDEIIVVDSFSTDQTEQICKRYQVLFIKRAFTDYASSKNFGNSYAQYPYILSLDADEALSDELRSNILEEKKDFKHIGYFFNRKTNYCGQWVNYCGWYPDPKLRLWQKTKGEWEGKIHEKVVLQDHNIGQLKGDILHYSYTSIQQHQQKLNHYTDLMAKDLFDKDKKATFVKLYLSPIFKFFRQFILQGGFLDGYYGFIICKMSYQYTRQKYLKLKGLYHIQK